MSSEITGREIELRRNVPYPEVPENKKAGVDKVTDVLVYQGKVSEEQVRLARETQKNNPRQDLGKILLSLGFISGADLAQAQAQRLGLDFVELTRGTSIGRGSSRTREGTAQARRHPAQDIPHRHLVVAMSDPSNLYALEDLRIISGYQITPSWPPRTRSVTCRPSSSPQGSGSPRYWRRRPKPARKTTELDLGIEAGPDEKPIIRLVSSVLQHAVGDGASDIHIEPQAREVTVRFRVDGVLREVMSIPPKLQHSVTARFKLLADLNIAEKRLPQDGRFSVKINDQKIDFRVASCPRPTVRRSC